MLPSVENFLIRSYPQFASTTTTTITSTQSLKLPHQFCYHEGGEFFCYILFLGASIPSEAMMHFPSVSDFPYFSGKNSYSVKTFPDFTFSQEILLPSAKISDDVFSKKFPSFAVSVHFPTISRKLFPLLLQISFLIS